MEHAGISIRRAGGPRETPSLEHPVEVATLPLVEERPKETDSYKARLDPPGYSYTASAVDPKSGTYSPADLARTSYSGNSDSRSSFCQA